MMFVTIVMKTNLMLIYAILISKTKVRFCNRNCFSRKKRYMVLSIAAMFLQKFLEFLATCCLSYLVFWR